MMSMMLQSGWALAHPPGLSSLDAVIQTNQIQIKTTFAVQDIEAFTPMDADLDAEVSDSEREAAKPKIAQLLAEQLSLNLDGNPLQPNQVGKVSYDDQNNAQVELLYPAAPKQQLILQSKFLSLLPDGHQQFLVIKGADEKIIAEKMLTKQDDQISVQLSNDGSQTQTSSTFSDFFKLGIEHILTGYDHLLFLFALLAVTHKVGPALKIITFFTLAHSITLAAAGLNLLDIPSSIVEPLIAATIIYVGIENIIRGDHPKGRHWLTFGFGLIHGFGFAGVLREMDISSGDTGILFPLLSFNLGIETGQICIAALVLPMIWWLNNKVEIAEKFLKGCSILVSLMGAYWLLERTLL
jgi:hydrogenase/urease accessory protein HupE